MDFEWDWKDNAQDVGHITVPDAKAGIVQLYLHQADCFRSADDDFSDATHYLNPDTARAIADALIESARQIDGKAAGVSDLVSQLEQARAEIERLKGTPTDNGFRTAPARYVQQERETIDRIRDAMTDTGFVAFCLGTAMRYEDRRGAKGDPEGDAEKARWYRQMIAHVNGDGPDPRADRPGFVPYRRIGGDHESR